MYNFCTYFDRNFLVRGLTLFHSLRRLNIPIKLWVLCYDDYTYEVLTRLNYEEMECISLSDFEEMNPGLVRVKGERSRVEYYWTSTPLLPLYVFLNWSEVGEITYLDADLYFFNSPDPAYREWGNGSVYIVPHRFANRFQSSGEEIAGKYNVGYLMFRNDQEGRKCLEWWSSRCLEWCFNRAEDGKLGDQKYLDEFRGLFENVVVSEHIGINCGEWNVFDHSVTVENGVTKIDRSEMIVFHFNAVDLLSRKALFGTQGKRYSALYAPYATSIGNSISEILQIDPAFNYGYDPQPLIRRVYNTVRGKIFVIPDC